MKKVKKLILLSMIAAAMIMMTSCTEYPSDLYDYIKIVRDEKHKDSYIYTDGYKFIDYYIQKDEEYGMMEVILHFDKR